MLTRECPSVLSLVSASVRPDMVARALDAVHGVMSLTKGIGSMVFGTLLTMKEEDNLPGRPYETFWFELMETPLETYLNKDDVDRFDLTFRIVI